MVGPGERLRREPWRVFFPVGALLGGLGVAHWLLYALGLQEHYSGQGHALIQFQGFLTALACGFLLTMLPRRTQAAPPSLPTLALLVGGLLLTGAAALAERWLVAEAAFALVLVLLSVFTGLRLWSGGTRRPPDAFAVLPVGLAGGLVGALLLGAVGLDLAGRRAHAIGRGLIEEGLFLCLLLGVGAMILPLLSGQPVPGDADGSPRSLLRRVLHAAAGVVILASFPLQQVVADIVSPALGYRVGYGLRAGLVLLMLVASLGAQRRPRRSGTARTLVWIAFWLVPLGLLLVALFPARRVAFLHVVFIGGFGLAALALAAHVTLGHAGFPELRDGPVRSLRLAAFLFLFAMTTRVTADFVPQSYVLHLGGASAIWLAGLGAWLWLLLPKIISPRRPPE